MKMVPITMVSIHVCLCIYVSKQEMDVTMLVNRGVFGYGLKRKKNKFLFDISSKIGK